MQSRISSLDAYNETLDMIEYNLNSLQNTVFQSMELITTFYHSIKEINENTNDFNSIGGDKTNHLTQTVTTLSIAQEMNFYEQDIEYIKNNIHGIDLSLSNVISTREQIEKMIKNEIKKNKRFYNKKHKIQLLCNEIDVIQKQLERTDQLLAVNNLNENSGILARIEKSQVFLLKQIISKNTPNKTDDEKKYSELSRYKLLLSNKPTKENFDFVSEMIDTIPNVKIRL
ncbi:hypothetical protein TRFO_32105 [Tritrichomonas foetus]|uniref:Uncharacterized protein n=1 Tax=Tritrichomonas foetus TaxID=1144522 RepID=A0A1J4JPY5_9EUKA|nr:hypothetical protein TRFO_32105 [Tritrichomonas foetus]|eukprot:OHT01169.1 hypothetical protein TRFO_32105 [Tritrichomonas foetus]